MIKNEILTEKIVLSYLKKVAPRLGFKIKKIILVKEITKYSNANFIFKVTVDTKQGRKKLILRQSYAYNKRALKRGEKIFMNSQRVVGAARLMKLLEKLWGKKYVPQLLYFDKNNSILLMTDISAGGKLLIEEFEKNRVHPELGRLFGQLFGKLHGSTYATTKEYAGSLGWKKKVIKVLVYEFWSIGLKKFFPQKRVNNFLEQAGRATPSAVWADPVYRNIFVKKDSVGLVDFDHACTYDPAFDNGVLLTHWVWMMFKGDKQVKKNSEKFISDFIKAYKKTMITYQPVKPKDLAKIMARTIDWLALYLVSRTDGKSGSYFSQSPAWEKRIRQTGVDIFAKNFKNPEARKIKTLILN